MRRIPQPPVDLAARSREERSAWPGAVVAAMGLLLALFGLARITAVETVQNTTAREAQINLAFAHGGVRYVHPAAPSLPDGMMPPVGLPGEGPGAWGAPATSSARSRLLVDLGAKDPCPT